MTHKISSLIFLAVTSINAFASSCDQMVPFGYPQSTTILNSTQLCRIAYTVNHDNSRKTPIYSAQYLIKENLNGKTLRVNAFKADPDLKTEHRAELEDYDKRYDRGHMTPFEDTRNKSASALQTFYLSNIIPQNLHLNRGMWKALESRTRTWAEESKNGIYVFTGPVYKNKPIKIIGNGVAIPDHVYKVIIDKSTMQGVGFLIPNASPKSKQKFTDFAIPISEIEKVTSINFTPKSKDQKFKSVIGPNFK